ncbi:MAG: helix-turn-helix domain-containing protein [Pseudomonadota bacterium]
MATVTGLGAKSHKFTPGEHLFHQGDADRGIHRIVRGTVTVYRVTSDGYRQIEAFAGPGDYASLCLSSTSPTSAQALSEVETEYVGRADFERRLLEDAAFRAEVFREIDKASADARRQATLLACRCAMERVAAFVLFLDTHFAPGADGFVPIPMSRCEMADHLGLTLETVSRMLNRLKRNGVIALPRPDRFQILNLHRLATLSGDALDETSPRREAI